MKNKDAKYWVRWSLAILPVMIITVACGVLFLLGKVMVPVGETFIRLWESPPRWLTKPFRWVEDEE